MKVVFDTNVLISALIKIGKPKKLLNEIAERKALIISKEILDEFVNVAQEDKIRKYVDEEDVAVFLGFLKSFARVVKVSSKFSVVKEDPGDDVILRTAHDAKAKFIVSGDKHLLSLGKFRGMRILTIDEMLYLIEDEDKKKQPQKNDELKWKQK